MAATRALEDFEIKAIFDSITGRHANRDRAMLVIGIAGALRATELVSLTVGDVYDGKRVRTYVDLRPETTKFNKGRTIRLGKDVKQVVMEFIKWKREVGEAVDGAKALFRSQKGGHIARQTLFDIIKAIFGRAGVNQSPHALRKTGATLFYIESEYDLLATMHFLGHKSPEVTRKYIGLSSDQLVKYVERLNDHLFAAISGGEVGAAKSDTIIQMSDFSLEAVPTAALIFALHNRGLDVEYLASQVQTQQQQKAGDGDAKLIPFPLRRKVQA